AAQATASDYAVVVSKTTYNDPAWREVADALAARHDGQVVQFADSVDDAKAALAKSHPRFTCFVATPAEAGRDFVAQVHRLTRLYDADPWTDTQWGILTGYDAANALAIAKTERPLVVKKVASGTEVALDACTQGVWYDELVKGKTVEKKPAGKPSLGAGPADTTRALADTLSDYQADLFVTSGHATERDWQIGFTYRNGSFRSKAGKMYGVATSGERFEIASDNPKVYLPIGNCLMGHIDGPDAMALAWMNSCGVRQMAGYTVPTWYGYGGWGLLDYFVEQPGRYTLSEAFIANHQALLHRLYAAAPQTQEADPPPGGSVRVSKVADAGQALHVTAQDVTGLLHDRDVVAFYGDPAWEARMAPAPGALAYDQTLTELGGVYTLTITPRRGEDSFKPVNTNGAQRGWRPIVAFLPRRIGPAELIAGGDLQPLIADDFVLVPNPRECDPSRAYVVKFRAPPAKSHE
ncbi:MAG: hypothetical protein KDA41_17115, partial [Planctomycetales bacterium]|nr:hypothetical protein [Planctomycetales bacterium]